MDPKQLEPAKDFIRVALRDVIVSRGSDYSSFPDIIAQFSQTFLNGLDHDGTYINTTLAHIVLREMISDQLVDCVLDDFTPPYVRKTPDLEDQHLQTPNVRAILIKLEGLRGAGTSWLHSAFETIGIRFDRAELDNYFASILSKPPGGIAAPALNTKTVDDGMWEPIPLDRDDPALGAATASIDETIEALRADNGYGTAHPEEKTYVLDMLRQVRKRLAEDTQISWMYLNEFALKPLGIVTKRFGLAAIGVAAATARDAITAWLKSRGIHFLDDLFR